MPSSRSKRQRIPIKKRRTHRSLITTVSPIATNPSCTVRTLLKFALKKMIHMLSPLDCVCLRPRPQEHCYERVFCPGQEQLHNIGGQTVHLSICVCNRPLCVWTPPTGAQERALLHVGEARWNSSIPPCRIVQRICHHLRRASLQIVI